MCALQSNSRDTHDTSITDAAMTDQAQPVVEKGVTPSILAKKTGLNVNSITGACKSGKIRAEKRPMSPLGHKSTWFIPIDVAIEIINRAQGKNKSFEIIDNPDELDSYLNG